jgi:carboxyl-terminal processing protease
MKRILRHFWIGLIALSVPLQALTPPLKPWDVTNCFEEVRQVHARADKKLTPELAQRILSNYLDMLDLSRYYLLASEVEPWLHATPEKLSQLCRDYQKWQFTQFEQLDQLMARAVARRAAWKPSNQLVELKKDKETWADSEQELHRRWQEAHQRLQQMAQKLAVDGVEARMVKRRLQWEEQWTGLGAEEQERKRLVRILKASAASLDDHTTYFTPQEVKSLKIDMEQRLMGIGVQLRDDLDLGFTIIRILENGPAERSGEIKTDDRIAAINGEDVVGLEVDLVVEKIRGRRGTEVELKLLRQVDGALQTVNVTLVRDEVIFEGKQCEVSVHPFGKGVIGRIALHSFYADARERSSTHDVKEALAKLQKEHQLLGVILDMRQNGGGLLGEALQVASLFLPDGAAVVVQDPSGELDYVQSNPQEQLYKGPLLMLTSRISASGAEIVAQVLQEQGRAMVVGDDRTFGKGSYQVLSNPLIGSGKVDPKGEFKVTRGCYYTLSGRTPQLEGVLADLVVPSPVAQLDVGERFGHYPLPPEPIQLPKALVPAKPPACLTQLRNNSKLRMSSHPTYEALVKLAGEKEDRDAAEHVLNLQLEEAFSVMKDLIVLNSNTQTEK